MDLVIYCQVIEKKRWALTSIIQHFVSCQVHNYRRMCFILKYFFLSIFFLCCKHNNLKLCNYHVLQKQRTKKMVISNVVELFCLTGRNTLNTYSVYVIWKYLHRISCGQNNKTTGNRIASTLFYDLFPKSMQIRQITFPVLKNYATRAFFNAQWSNFMAVDYFFIYNNSLHF